MNISIPKSIPKSLISIGIPAAICLCCIFVNPKFAFAENIDIEAIKTQIEAYISSDKFDLLGRNFDKEYFSMVKEYAGRNPFKMINADLSTMGLQWKAKEKILQQNDDLYLMLGGSYGFKFVPNAEKIKLLKMLGGSIKYIFR